MSEDFDDVDTISLVNLQLPNGVIARDIWDEDSIQPAFVTIVLELRNGFKSAASLDELDASTVHYGKLAKAVREACDGSLIVDRTHHKLLEALMNTIPRSKSDFIVSKAEITVTMPKASIHGESLTNVRRYSFDAAGVAIKAPTHIMTFQKLRLLALIGVNDKERRGRQSIVLTCQLIGVDNAFCATSITEVSGIEREIAMIVEQTEYETLEALANHTSTAIYRWLEEQQHVLSGIRLDIEKPSAVLHADAPVITVKRCFMHPHSKKRSHEAADT